MKNTSIIKSFQALGTVNTVRLMGGSSTIAAKAVMRRVKEISDKMYYYKRSSEIYELNAMAGKGLADVTLDTMKVLKRAKYFKSLTDGAFDITSQPLTNVWDRARQKRSLPSQREIIKAKELLGGLNVDDVKLKAGLEKENQCVGLGGIAKGYAADEAVKVVREFGINNALIILGGNIWAIGDKEGAGWRVGIQNPVEPRGVTLGDVMVFDETIVSSGVNEKFFINDGVRYHHIIDPRTGRPSQTGLLSVTLIGKSSMDLDALATSAFILGMHDGAELVKSMGVQAVFVDNTLNVFATSGLKGRLNLKTESKNQKSAAM
jgi:thiamine biosynthesis lipoprotein